MNARRPHSPDYPSISLAEAVERCNKLFGVLQMRPGTRDLVGAGLGFAKMHGGAMSALAALRKYGLLTRVGENLALTELAKTILLPKSPEESAVALKQAALNPELFKQIYETFGHEIKDVNLVTNHLLREGFLPEAARKALHSYKETAPYLAYAGLAADSTRDYNPPIVSGGGEDAMLTETVPDVVNATSPPQLSLQTRASKGGVAPAASPSTDDERELLHGLLSRSVSYRLVVRGDAGPKELGNLIKMLEMQKAVLEDDAGN